MRGRKLYYKNIKKLFPAKSEKERQFLRDYKEQIDEYELDHPNCTYNELEEYLGTPIDIVVSYFQSVDSSYLLKQINIKRTIKKTCVIVFLIAISVAMWEIHNYNQAYKNFYDEFHEEYQNYMSEPYTIDPRLH